MVETKEAKSMDEKSACKTDGASLLLRSAEIISEEKLAIESLLDMRSQAVVNTSRVPIEPSELEMNECKTLRSKTALENWYQRLNELYEYKQEHGNCDVPQKYPPNRCLGIWVNKQRCEKVVYDELREQHELPPSERQLREPTKIKVYKKHRKNPSVNGDDENSSPDENEEDETTHEVYTRTNLTAQKVYQLEKVGFVWAKRKGDVIWNLRYQELYEFFTKHGHSDLPCKYRPKPTLGRWVTSQRSMRKRGNLPTEYVKKLDAINFTWDMYSKTNVSYDPTDQNYQNSEAPTSSSNVPQLQPPKQPKQQPKQQPPKQTQQHPNHYPRPQWNGSYSNVMHPPMVYSHFPPKHSNYDMGRNDSYNQHPNSKRQKRPLPIQGQYYRTPMVTMQKENNHAGRVNERQHAGNGNLDILLGAILAKDDESTATAVTNDDDEIVKKV
jgi:Helicase associated domain